MFFSGIADEASPDLTRQIEAHKELGWDYIELRMIDGKNFVDLDDAAYEKVAAQVTDAGLKVSCFAAQLANWARPIDTDFEVDLAELNRAAPRMKELGTSFIRCMSYPNCKPALGADEWREKVIERMRELASIAESHGITLVHENCDGWGGLGPTETMELLREVGSRHLKLVFDTGNPIPHNQDAWEYYQGVKSEIAYVHIKDYSSGGEDEDEVACYPGEGRGYVREILTDLLANGYDGGVSIEPHITSVIHLSQEAADPETAFRTYIEYGRRLEALVAEIGTA